AGPAPDEHPGVDGYQASRRPPWRHGGPEHDPDTVQSQTVPIEHAGSDRRKDEFSAHLLPRADITPGPRQKWDRYWPCGSNQNSPACHHGDRRYDGDHAGARHDLADTPPMTDELTPHLAQV